jgi:tripartite-type tricarboxylate transporter receptor subunit TctC
MPLSHSFLPPDRGPESGTTSGSAAALHASHVACAAGAVPRRRALHWVGAGLLAGAVAPRMVRAQSGAAAALAGLAAAASPAVTPGWPNRPLRLMVGFGAGSSPDLVARTVAEPLSQALGQAVVVENHPGASGNIAATQVARATDQHTIGMLINGNLTIARLLNPATAYEPQQDLQPLSLLCVAPMVLAVPSTLAGAQGQAFAAMARAVGDRWSYGSPGQGTLGHLGMEVLKSRTGWLPVHVPYQGNPQVITAMVGGQVQLALLPPGLARAQVEAGRLRAIGVTSSRRSNLVPEMSTLSEAGLPEVALEIWTAAAAPTSMPAAIAQRLSLLIAQIVQTQDVAQKLFRQGYEAVGSTAQQLGERMRSDTALLGGIIRSQGIVQ